MFAPDSQLTIKVARPDDLDPAVQFFERTAYAAEELDERTVALTPPDELDESVARREVKIYLGMLERLHPGVIASVVD
jgi:hypothetical protein